MRRAALSPPKHNPSTSESKALKAEGLSNVDAIRKVAEESGKKENAVRANQHQYRQKLEGGGSPGTPRRRSALKLPALTAESAVAQAKQLLEQALAAIDGEVEAAKTELDAVQAHYDELVASVKDRKEDLERKIEGLA